MCGICGIFDLSGRPVEVELIRRMMSVIRHRGPDGEGMFVKRNAGLGHRRLSIIDLEGGRQPLGNEDGTIQVVFNGEIYNFIELTRELESFGHKFQSRSDTEVIVHAYEQWGHACVERFNGMFAFALWDYRKDSLFLARDHLGIKPLYYAVLGDRLVFASEIKAILLDPSYCRAVNPDALGQLFTFRYVPSPHTLFKGIQKLPPAHFMTVSRSGFRVERFWKWVPKQAAKTPKVELITEYQALLEDSIRLQLRSDVPLGLFLSSGIDSAAILAIMRQYCSGRVKAFTIGFEGGERTNEVDDAKDLARMFDAEHHSLTISPEDYKKYFERFMWDLEEPLGNETAAAFYFVSKIASQHVKVALTGQGADEPWAGYGRHLGAKLSILYSRLPRALTRGVFSRLFRLFPALEQLKRGTLALDEPDILTRFAKVYSFFDAAMKDRLYQPWLKETLGDFAYGSKENLRRLQSDVAHLDALTQMLYVDTRSNLPDDLLMVGDKTTMANSLEARVPYLDYRLVQFIERLPPGLRLRNMQAKYLHKRALERWLPRNIVYRKKKGFDNPIGNWLRTSMYSFVEELLLSSDAGVGRFFDQRYIRWILQQNREGHRQFHRHVYLLLSFELWHRKFMRGGGAT